MSDTVTNEQAHEMYCPTSFANLNSNSLCRGKHCMAWRTTGTKKMIDGKYMSVEGYCGMAGRPE